MARRANDRASTGSDRSDERDGNGHQKHGHHENHHKHGSHESGGFRFGRDDVTRGSRGDDVLLAAAGDDMFIFGTGAGADVIGYFGDGADVLDLSDVDGLSTVADVMSSATQVGADTVLDFGGGDQITLIGVEKASLLSDDFLL